ncbi:M42 family metallopeptidase [Anaerosalibacter sp. Marseille-P3206]|uniref:M42 family metallopeptidase n=1 Tax=Anaerosalibacter sp. Marseille-P3206 TaxID=1871005 RepID=UPI0009842E7C|nr:M42 family metallopeptidase [Anaerosalibacter sp. Marseille-P3206]
MKIDTENILNKMKKYLDIPSPGGFTKEATLEVKKDFEMYGLNTNLTNKGALIATLEGENDEEHVMITAHIDTLGCMVKDITSDGKLKYNKIGGGSWSSIEGENCYIITRKGKKIRGSIIPTIASAHIYGPDKNDARDESVMRVRIDEDVNSKEDVLNLGINIGDFICLDTRTEVTESGFVKSRYLDDKLAVAILVEIARCFSENNMKPKYTTHFFISNYEEIGHGVAGIPEKVKEMIAVDIGIVGEGQNSDEHSVSIVAMDRRSPYDFEFRNKLVDIAEENNIKYKVDLYNFYSSDSTHVAGQGKDVNFASLGPAVDASHHYERTHMDSIINTAQILLNYLMVE